MIYNEGFETASQSVVVITNEIEIEMDIFEYMGSLEQKDRRDSSTKTGDKEMVSLKEYVERMNDDQKATYCIIDESKAGMEASPFLEAVKQPNLYLFVRQCDEKHVKSVDKTMNLAQRLALYNLDNKKA
eukprot:235949_1